MMNRNLKPATQLCQFMFGSLSFKCEETYLVNLADSVKFHANCNRSKNAQKSKNINKTEIG